MTTAAFFRDSAVGNIIWWLCKPQSLSHPEERKGFVYKNDLLMALESKKIPAGATGDTFNDNPKTNTISEYDPPLEPITHATADNVFRTACRHQLESHTKLNIIDDQTTVYENDVEKAAVIDRELRGDQISGIGKETPIVIEWYPGDDEAPLNWSKSRKLFVLLCIGLYSFVVYMGAPVYTPSVEYFVDEFGVSTAYASLGLGTYVLGYGFGPLFFGPLSEVPSIGRAILYPASFFGFVLISIGTACTKSAPGFMFLRFLQGFFGSPALSTGGATIADIYSADVLPFAMTTWVVACNCSPAIGPLIAGYAIPVMGWRFSMWELCIASSPVMILLCFLPETSAPTLLLRRARRLRQITGIKHLKSESEIAMHGIDLNDIIKESLLTPMKITFLDPAMLFANIYTSLIYGIYYSFFEVFPLVYMDIYKFNLGEMGTVFLAIVFGALVACVIYHVYIYKVHMPRARSGRTIEPEKLLIPALYSCFFPPIGLFLFGWTSNIHVHWIVPTLGIVIFPASVFFIMQCIFMYIPSTYPQYAASIFAATDVTRCIFAFAAILFARPLFLNLHISGGCSLLAGFMMISIGGMHLLYHYGAALRRRSKFTSKY